MARKTSVSRKAEASAKRMMKESRDMTLSDIFNDIQLASGNNGGKVPYGYMPKLIRGLKKFHPWLTRDIINMRFMRTKKNIRPIGMGILINITPGNGVESDLSADSSSSNSNSTPSSIFFRRSKGGRPVGTTLESKRKREKDFIDAKNIIAKRYKKEKDKLIRGGNTRMKKGYLRNLIEKVKEEKGLTEDIPESTIIKRYDRNMTHVTNKSGHESSLLEIDSTIVYLLIQMGRIRMPLTASGGISLIHEKKWRESGVKKRTEVQIGKDHWIVCIGVPYGTALWQVGDSKEQNGSFNIALTKAKHNLLKEKERMILNGSLEPTDIMPLVNYAWKHSFARVNTNKNAIADRGWNPYNRNILTFPTVRTTMTTQEREMESCNITLPSTILENNSETCNENSTSAVESTVDAEVVSKLNFSSGTSAYCIDSLIIKSDSMKARERIKKDVDDGKSVKEMLQSSKRETAEILIKAGTNRLGMDLLEIHKENQLKQKIETQKKLKKQKEDYEKTKSEADDLLRKKIMDKMTISELKTILKQFKRKTDGAMPLKRTHLLTKYEEWRHRPPPVFEDLDKSILSDDDNIIESNNEQLDIKSGTNLENEVMVSV